jgi:hypothetical protein
MKKVATASLPPGPEHSIGFGRKGGQTFEVLGSFYRITLVEVLICISEFQRGALLGHESVALFG